MGGSEVPPPCLTRPPRPPTEQASSPPQPSAGPLSGCRSPVWRLMPAIVTTLGILTFYSFPLVSCLPSSLFYLLARSLSLAALAWGVSQTFQPQLPPRRLAGSGVKGLPSACRPRGARCTGFRLVSPACSPRRKWGVEGSPRQICFGKKVSSGARGGSCHHRGYAHPDLPTPRLTFPWGS